LWNERKTTRLSHKRRKEIIMMGTSQMALQDRMDLMLEAMIERLVESRSHAETAPRMKNAVSTALTDALLMTLATSPVSTDEQVSPREAELASMLAVSLAPMLAEALTPAIVKALRNMAVPEQTDQKEDNFQRQP
jgi:hypothetical protein